MAKKEGFLGFGIFPIFRRGSRKKRPRGPETPRPPREIGRVASSMKSANPEISREQAIETIAESEWAQEWAESMCSLGGRKATKECIRRMSRDLAKEVYEAA